MGWLSRLFSTQATTADIETQIAAYIADRLDAMPTDRLPTVISGRMLIADTAATMPMVATDGRRRITPTPSLLRRPDPREPYRRTIEKICNSLTGWGMAWMRVYDTGYDGHPLAVRVVHPKRVQWQLSSNEDEIIAVWIDGVRTDLATVRWIPFRSDLGPIGTSPLNDIDAALAQLASIYRFGQQYYDITGIVPPYALKHPTRLDRKRAREFADEWAAARAERRPAVLSGGVEIETYTATSAAEAMVWDAIDSLDATVSRSLLIPPSLLNVKSMTTLTYSTTVGEFQRWLQLGLFPGYLSRIEAAFTDMLPRGTNAAFDTSSLTRMDFAGRMDAYATSLGAGIHTVDEVRALEGLPPRALAAPDPVQANVEGM